jgi:hypothetical protein
MTLDCEYWFFEIEILIMLSKALGISISESRQVADFYILSGMMHLT